MKFYTYILRLADNKYYTGITNCLSRRLYEHNHDSKGYVLHHRPAILIWYNEHSTRAEARRQEVIIKHTGAKKYLIKNFNIYPDTLDALKK